MFHYSLENVYTFDLITYINNLEEFLAHNLAFRKIDINNQAVNNRSNIAEPIIVLISIDTEVIK